MKVVVTDQTIKNGYDHDKEQAKKYLKVGSEYEVEHIVVGGWHTDIYLVEFPKIPFNSVNFRIMTDYIDSTAISKGLFEHLINSNKIELDTAKRAKKEIKSYLDEHLKISWSYVRIGKE